jgi:hypothetical protein
VSAVNEQGGFWGEHDMMAIAAFRACLGRRYQMPAVCSAWIIANWTRFEPMTRELIEQELEDRFEADDDSRYRGLVASKVHPLGRDQDREQWEQVRKLWHPRSPVLAGFE